MFFFFNDTATTEIYTLSLHDALPICNAPVVNLQFLWENQTGAKQATAARLLWDDENLYVSYDVVDADINAVFLNRDDPTDRKSTRLNSSHANISYAVFCLKKKKNIST